MKRLRRMPRHKKPLAAARDGLTAARESRLMAVVVSPVISEKSTDEADKNRTAVFRVNRFADKKEIAAAVEKMFEVKVEKVQTSTQHGKAVGRMHRGGRRASWKKAYIRLAPGNDINFAELQ